MEQHLLLDERPAFSRVRVTAVSSLSTSEKDSDLLGAAVIAWTSLEPSDDVFAEVDVRGVLTLALPYPKLTPIWPREHPRPIP
jgi:hypothetical protein